MKTVSQEDSNAAIDKLGAAIAEAVSSADVQDVLALLTGTFVALTLEMLRREGHDPKGDILLDGGENRDITIHKAKV
jgi:ketosteroid isomerase-like protein